MFVLGERLHFHESWVCVENCFECTLRRSHCRHLSGCLWVLLDLCVHFSHLSCLSSSTCQSVHDGPSQRDRWEMPSLLASHGLLAAFDDYTEPWSKWFMDLIKCYLLVSTAHHLPCLNFDVHSVSGGCTQQGHSCFDQLNCSYETRDAGLA